MCLVTQLGQSTCEFYIYIHFVKFHNYNYSFYTSVRSSIILAKTMEYIVNVMKSPHVF